VIRDDGGLGLVVAEQLADFGAVVDETEEWVDEGGVDVVDGGHRGCPAGVLELQVVCFLLL